MGKYLSTDLIAPLAYRQLPSNADKEAYELVKNTVPKAETHPNVFAWYVLVGRFAEVARNSWAGAAAAPAKAAAKAAPAKKEEPKKEAKAADDEMDLFGDDDEEDAVSSCYPASVSLCAPEA